MGYNAQAPEMRIIPEASGRAALLPLVSKLIAKTAKTSIAALVGKKFRAIFIVFS
jgi:hypothetical protein